MKIGKYTVSQKNAPIIIAEMSGNHNKSLNRALKLVEFAAKAGAHMLKLQTYTADTLTIKSGNDDFLIKSKESLWKGRTLYDLYEDAYTPWEWHEKIIKKCNEHGIICFSTPFDETAVDFLEKLDVPAYKIASFENVHLPLIRKVARTGKPVIISTGLASIEEIEDAVKTLREEKCQEFALLKCTSAYPALPENSNILTIPDLRDKFKCEVGLSDHTIGIGSALAAISHGATIIEKHFTMDKKDGGVDSSFSIDPNELKLLVKESKKVWQSLGQVQYGPTDSEKPSLQFRRSIYVVEDIKKDGKLTNKNLRIIRPGKGLLPKHYENLIGRKVNRELKKGTPIKWEFLSE
ncbi:pseudaminic acid synthase [Pelagibacteraceae bacterium]|nr:pseudaminic acid synthase [Pelagibacteraceae bacterium]